jgi:hypothetical protein
VLDFAWQIREQSNCQVIAPDITQQIEVRRAKERKPAPDNLVPEIKLRKKKEFFLHANVVVQRKLRRVARFETFYNILPVSIGEFAGDATRPF